MPNQPLLDAIKLYQVKNYKDALLAFRKLAKSHTEAAYYLGLMNLYGLGTSVDEKAAYRLFRKAWEGLYPDAIYMLGVCYEEGRGIQKDLKQAFEYYQAAAKNGSTQGTLKVAKFYEDGISVKQSLKTAIELYVKLSQQDHPYAMYKIGVFYLEGRGLKQSKDNAYTWLNKALAAGSVEAMNYFRFLGVKSKNDARSTSEIYQVAESYLDKGAYEDGIQLLEIAAKEKYIPAVIRLSDLYLRDMNLPAAADKSFKILLKYKDLDDAQIYYRIAQKYEQGEGVYSSFIKAALFYELALKKQHPDAKEALVAIRGY